MQLSVLQMTRSGAAVAPAAHMDHVTRDFAELHALSDVSFEVPRGALVGVIGPSGAGKTTAISMFTGNLVPTRGTVRTLGEQPLHLRRRTRERIGLMPQQFTLYPELTSAENVDFIASLFGLLAGKRRRRTREVLKVVDLWEARNRTAAKLSGGMQRRLQLACALVHEPELLILDEPTGGIDPLLRQSVWRELVRQRELGRTARPGGWRRRRSSSAGRISDAAMNLSTGPTRTFAVVGKEILVVIRRPSALATLVIGPVVILAVFGLSYVGQPPIRAMLVVPGDSGLP